VANKELLKELEKLAKEMRADVKYYAGSEAAYAFGGYAAAIEKLIADAAKEQKRGEPSNSVRLCETGQRRVSKDTSGLGGGSAGGPGKSFGVDRLGTGG